MFCILDSVVYPDLHGLRHALQFQTLNLPRSQTTISHHYPRSFDTFPFDLRIESFLNLDSVEGFGTPEYVLLHQPQYRRVRLKQC